jgi:hypothetical protein
MWNACAGGSRVSRFWAQRSEGWGSDGVGGLSGSEAGGRADGEIDRDRLDSQTDRQTDRRACSPSNVGVCVCVCDVYIFLFFNIL